MQNSLEAKKLKNAKKEKSICIAHIPVLHEEIVNAIQSIPAGTIIIDCTAGFGGHIKKILPHLPEKSHIVGLDRDPDAIGYLKKVFAGDNKVSIRHCNFSQIGQVAESLSLKGKIGGIYADLGVSSFQLDTPSRGFSFQQDGPLDMRMNPELGLPASSVVNEWSEKDLTHLFYQFGEDPKSRKIAALICQQRQKKPFFRTSQLADLIKAEIRYKKPSKKHPATRIFQALRIFVNSELDELTQVLEQGFDVLTPQGRLAIISFHSLEDAIVKTKMRSLSQRNLPSSLAKLPIPEQTLQEKFPIQGRIIRPFPTLPSKYELSQNPRSRSAKLRIIEKI